MSKQFPFNIITKPVGSLCNLRCDYCFYLKKESMFQAKTLAEYEITKDALDKYISDYIRSQPEGTREINFVWQGGEPTLLSVEFYKTIVTLQKKYSRAGMNISNSLQTNATLLDDGKIIFFKDNNFLIGVSIDGPEDLHDLYRRDASGNGSFKMVMRGIELLQKYNAEFNTLTAVNNFNSKAPERVYKFLRETGSNFFQFIPIVEPVYDGTSDEMVKPDFPGPEFIPGRVSERSVDALSWGNFLVEVFKCWASQDIGGIFVQHFDLFLGIYMGYPPSLCSHSKNCGKAMAMEHNGNLYSCDHFVFEENYLGNIFENELKDLVTQDLQITFGEAKYKSLTEECRRCPFLKLCWGGCLKDRIVKTKSGFQNYLCSGYLNFFQFSFPYFQAMATALSRKIPASEYRMFIDKKIYSGVKRNEPCPCLSGKKFKNCCG